LRPIGLIDRSDQKEVFMYDLAFVALGLGLIGLLCAYANALKNI